MQYTVDAVCSGIVVYGGGDIVFDTKKVKAVDAVCSTQWNSAIWWWRHCLWCIKVKPVDAMDAVCSGHSGIMVYGGVCAVYCIQCIHWFDLFAPKTLSQPPYTTIPLHSPHTATTIPLHPLCYASTGLTFLYQRQCPHQHIPLFYCVHCVLCPLV